MIRFQIVVRLICVVKDKESLAFCEQQKQEWEPLKQELEQLQQERERLHQEWKQRKQEWGQELIQRKQVWVQRKQEWIQRKQEWERKNVLSKDQDNKECLKRLLSKWVLPFYAHFKDCQKAHLKHIPPQNIIPPGDKIEAAQKSVPLQPHSELSPAQPTYLNASSISPHQLRTTQANSVLVNSNERVVSVSTTRSIVLLADLMVAATSKDFKLIASQPLSLVKYPNSFQATVVQITNKGYDAFNEAQKSMTQLVQLAERGATLASESLNVIEEGEPADIQDFLPITLKEIIDVVGKCAVMTSAVVSKYDDLVRLIREILGCNIPHVQVLQLLKDTSAEMSVVQKQWEYLASFFAKIVEIIEGSLQKTILEFIQIVEQEQAEKNKHKNIPDREGGRTESGDEEFEDSGELGTVIAKHESENVKKKKNLLTEDIKQISEVANKIHETAVIYSEISQRYLLKCILSLNSLAAMNPTKDSAAMEGLQKEIRQDCLKADQAITEKKLQFIGHKTLGTYRTAAKRNSARLLACISKENL